MKYIQTVFKNSDMILQLGISGFKNRFAGTGLGVLWGFIQPFVYMFTYVIVFQYILKVGNTGDVPYMVWFLPGMTMWLFVNDSILQASGSIRNYSFLVKKVVFPVDIIPNISFLSSAFVGLFLLMIAVIVCTLMGYFMNIFYFIYILFSAMCFITAITRLTSAICTLVPDFEQLLAVVMQLFFWFTPIVWSMDQLGPNLKWLEVFVNCLPFTYLVNGFRGTFVNVNIITGNKGIYTFAFWTVTTLIFVWANKVFDKSKKDFADVL